MAQYPVSSRLLPRRHFVVSACGLSVAVLLSACVGSAGSESSQAATTTTGSAAPSVTGAAKATSTAGPPSASVPASSASAVAPASTSTIQSTSSVLATQAPKAGTTSLHVMDFDIVGTPQVKARWEKTKTAFLQSNPEVTILEDFTNTFAAKLPVLVSSGTPPDVARIRRQAEFPSFAPHGVLVDLTPSIARSKVVPKGDFYASALDMQSISGKIYTLPDVLDYSFLYYNKNLFDAQGLNYPDLTWDYQDWLDAATKLNKYQDGGWTQVGGRVPSFWTVEYAGNVGQLLWQGGPTQPGVCTRVNYDQPGAIQAYEWYQGITCKSHVSPTDAENAKLKLDFTSGKVAMLLSFDQRQDFNTAIKGAFDWDCTLEPLGDKTKPRIEGLVGEGVAIFSLSNVKDVAWKYLEFTNDPSTLLQQVRDDGATSVYANRKVQESPEYNASTIPPSNKKVIVDGIAAGRFFPQPSWEMKGMNIAWPTAPATPNPAICGGAVPVLAANLNKQLTDNLQAHGVALCP